jgi:STE24 endopeptidase
MVLKGWNRVLLMSAVLLYSAAALAQDAQPKPLVPPDRVIAGYTLQPDQLAKATMLHRVRVRLMIGEIAFGLVLLIAFLYGRVGPRIRDLAGHITKRVGFQGLIYAPLLLLTLIVFQLPIDMYGHHLSLSYGLSIQSWGSWFGDWGKSITLIVLIGSGAICGVYAIIRRSPRKWWLWLWILSLPLAVFFLFLMPLVIDPMFHRFDPLELRHAELVSEIEKVAHHGGLDIPRNRIFEMHASDKVTTLYAYVKGIGASKRVVFGDNTVKELTGAQTLYVFGHEMGHYVLNHIWKGLGFLALLLLAAYYLGHRLGGWAISRYGRQWGIHHLSDWASLPLLILIIALFAFITEPMTSGFSRHLEHQADQYGIEVIHGIVPNANQAAAQAFQALSQKSLSYPYPGRWLIFWTYDHPAISDRVQFVLHHNPWAEGKEPDFVKPR